MRDFFLFSPSKISAIGRPRLLRVVVILLTSFARCLSRWWVALRCSGLSPLPAAPKLLRSSFGVRKVVAPTSPPPCSFIGVLPSVVSNPVPPTSAQGCSYPIGRKQPFLFSNRPFRGSKVKTFFCRLPLCVISVIWFCYPVSFTSSLSGAECCLITPSGSSKSGALHPPLWSYPMRHSTTIFTF